MVDAAHLKRLATQRMDSPAASALEIHTNSHSLRAENWRPPVNVLSLCGTMRRWAQQPGLTPVATQMFLAEGP